MQMLASTTVYTFHARVNACACVYTRAREGKAKVRRGKYRERVHGRRGTLVKHELAIPYRV